MYDVVSTSDRRHSNMPYDLQFFTWVVLIIVLFPAPRICASIGFIILPSGDSSKPSTLRILDSMPRTSL